MSDLDSILSDEPIDEVQDAPEEQALEAPEAEEAPQVEEPQVEDEPEAKQVPLAALQETRGENKELKASLQQLQAQVAAMNQPQQPQRPEFIDPEGSQFIQSQMQGAISNVRLDVSEDMTRQQFGDEIVDQAFSAFQSVSSPAERQAIMAARSPWAEVVKWHKRQQVSAEIGDDVDGWREKERAQMRQELLTELQAKQVAESVSQVKAPSLANEPNLGSRAAPTWAGPSSLDEILGG